MLLKLANTHLQSNIFSYDRCRLEVYELFVVEIVSLAFLDFNYSYCISVSSRLVFHTELCIEEIILLNSKTPNRKYTQYTLR